MLGNGKVMGRCPKAEKEPNTGDLLEGPTGGGTSWKVRQTAFQVLMFPSLAFGCTAHLLRTSAKFSLLTCFSGLPASSLAVTQGHLWEPLLGEVN